jgi:hypothetical protein
MPPTLRLLPELEDALRRLPGVTAASVVTGPDRAPTEIHVLALPGKPAKQVVRDVQSLAMAAFDIDIDHRIVSVVQIGDDEVRVVSPDGQPATADGESEAEAVRRPAIASVMVRTTRGLTEVAVALAAPNDLFEGKAEGPAGHGHRARIIARATLAALDDLLGQSCEVETSQVVSTGQRDIAVSVLTLQVPRIGEQVLTGCAVVRDDEAHAVVRSVLAALNRQLTG